MFHVVCILSLYKYFLTQEVSFSSNLCALPCMEPKVGGQTVPGKLQGWQRDAVMSSPSLSIYRGENEQNKEKKLSGMVELTVKVASE